MVSFGVLFYVNFDFKQILQDENARLVQRESALVTQIEGMEKQMQKYVQVS